MLDAFGIRYEVLGYEVLDPAGCVQAEPALALARCPIAGGLRLLGDETGDAHLFTTRLAAAAGGLNVQFRYGTRIMRILADGNGLTRVETDRGA